MPMLIPESLLLKEADHVEGFAPEVAWVTQGGTEPLAERLAVRPTSETIFLHDVRQVGAELARPATQNTTSGAPSCAGRRPPAGSCARPSSSGRRVTLSMPLPKRGAGGDDADAGRLPRLLRKEPRDSGLLRPEERKGKVSPARARRIPSEAMMQDGKALQSGTSHNFGTNFSEPFEIKYLDKDGTQKYAHETSWGTSTPSHRRDHHDPRRRARPETAADDRTVSGGRGAGRRA